MSRAKAAVLKLLRAWQWTRRFRQPACRFYPSCSEYTRQAVEKHGLAAGMRLGVVRICKCHPFHDGGVDEVPDTVKPMFRGMSVRTALMQPEAGWQPALPGAERLRREPCQIVMKTGLNPVLAGTKGKISTK